MVRMKNRYKIDGDCVHISLLGLYSTEQEAHAAYLSSKLKNHPYFENIKQEGVR